MMRLGLGLGLTRGTASSGGGGTEVAMGSVTFSTDGNYTTGNYVDGPAYIVIPSGTANMSEPTPVQFDQGTGETLNGAQLNPSDTDDQGYDERASFWNAARNEATWPLSVTAGDIITKVISAVPETVPVGNDTLKGYFDEIAACYIVASEPAANSFSPAAVGWAARGTPTSYVVDIATKVAAITSRNTATHDQPSYTEIMTRLDHFSPLWPQVFSNHFSWYQQSMPRGTQDGANYGQFIASVYSAGMLALMSDSFTTPQKEAIATRLVSHGIQWYDAFDAVSDTISPDGGHFQFSLGVMALALDWTGRSASLATLLADYGGNFLQAFQFTASQAADCVSHTNAADPHTWRQRALTASSGLVATIPTVNSFPNYDPSQLQFFDGMTLVRDSDAASAGIVSHSLALSTGDDYPLTIDAAPSPVFAVSDVVHMVPEVTPVEGDYDWTVNGLARWSYFNPIPDAPYRPLVVWSGQLMFLKSEDIWHSTMDVPAGYILRANAADTPSATFNFPDTHGVFPADSVTNYAWEADYWADYSGDIWPVSVAPETIWDTGDYLDMTQDGLTSTSTTGFTFAGKFRHDAATDGSNYFVGSSNGQGTYLRRNDATTWTLRIRDAADAVVRYVNHPISISTTDGDPVSFLLVMDEAGETVTLTVDGVEIFSVATGTSGTDVIVPAIINALNTSGSGALDSSVFISWIGAGATTGSWSDFFDGSGDPTAAMIAGTAIGGVTPEFVQSGLAATWNALTGMTGTVTDA